MKKIGIIGLAGSTVLEARMPLALQGNFEPGLRIEPHLKDLNNTRDTAGRLGVPLDLSARTREMMQLMTAEGKGRYDHGGLIPWFEQRADVVVRDTTAAAAV